MGVKPSLTLIAQPEAFFHELVTEAMGRQKLSVTPETEFYLVNLLNRFMSTEQLFPRDENGSPRQEPLAFMVKEALETTEPQTQAALFRRVGDVSLYMAGYFQDSLNRKLVDVDYYIDMGGSAYQNAAARAETLRRTFAELSEKFSRFVDVLAEISEKTFPKSEKDLLRLYDVWLKTRSDRAAKALQEAGIVPNETLKKDWQ